MSKRKVYGISAPEDRINPETIDFLAEKHSGISELGMLGFELLAGLDGVWPTAEQLAKDFNTTVPHVLSALFTDAVARVDAESKIKGIPLTIIPLALGGYSAQELYEYCLSEYLKKFGEERLQELIKKQKSGIALDDEEIEFIRKNSIE